MSLIASIECPLISPSLEAVPINAFAETGSITLDLRIVLPKEGVHGNVCIAHDTLTEDIEAVILKRLV